MMCPLMSADGLLAQSVGVEVRPLQVRVPACVLECSSVSDDLWLMMVLLGLSCGNAQYKPSGLASTLDRLDALCADS